MNLTTLQQEWRDEPQQHKFIKTEFERLVDANPELKGHRDYIGNHAYGFGERAFWWLWKLILDELDSNCKLLEIGCFKGATLSVWKLLKPDARVYGVTPLDSTGIGWEGDYAKFISDLHDKFNQEQPTIIKGLSELPEAIEKATQLGKYDVVYIDGGHEKHHIDNDVLHYAPLVKTGGYLVVDDCANDLNMVFGEFQGIDPVTLGVNEYMAKHGGDWEFICSVVHIKVFKRK